MVPLCAAHRRGRVWGVLERIVELITRAISDRRHLAVNGNQGIAETIEFHLSFTLGRFDHEGAGHRKGHGGGVIPIIYEALCHVLDFDPLLFPWAKF